MLVGRAGLRALKARFPLQSETKGAKNMNKERVLRVADAIERTLRHLAETGEVVWQDRVTSDARKICRAFDAAEERESTEVGI